MVKLNDLELTAEPQSLFDNFNSFILSKDRRVFNKLMSRALLYNEIKDIPGDIVECGVFKGTGMYTFLKLKNIFNPNSSKKVIGFDFFDTEGLISSIGGGQDKEAMDTLFKKRNFEHKSSFKDEFHNQLLSHGFSSSDFELVEGDISITSQAFSQANPGLKISLLYLDLDLEIPTYQTLNNLWNNVTKGGIVVFDEYGYHKWSESKGVDRFIEEKNLEIKSLNFMCPTAYIKKI
jgi:hypothetical protein